MDHEEIENTLNDHEKRIEKLENQTDRQNELLSRINGKLDKLIWAIGGGMFALLMMMLKILIENG